MGPTLSPETSAFKLQTPGKFPEEYKLLSHCLMTFERFDVKVIIKNPVIRRWMRINGLYVTKLFHNAVPNRVII